MSKNILNYQEKVVSLLKAACLLWVIILSGTLWGAHGNNVTAESNNDVFSFEKQGGKASGEILSVEQALERAKKNPVAHIAGLDKPCQRYLQKAYHDYQKRIKDGYNPEFALGEYGNVIGAIIQVENLKKGFFKYYLFDPVINGGKVAASYVVAPFVNTYQGLKNRNKKQIMRGVAGLGAYAACVYGAYAAYYAAYIAPELARKAAAEREQRQVQMEADREERARQAAIVLRNERNRLRADNARQIIPVVIANGEQAQECPICFVDEVEMRLVCGHEVCWGCFIGQINVAVRERDIGQMRCMHAGCNESFAFDIRENNQGLIFRNPEDRAEEAQDLPRRCNDLLAQAELEDRPGYSKCPQGDCQSHTILAHERRQDVQCRACHHRYCSMCRAEPHPEMTCQQARRVRAVPNPVNLPAGIKQCPRCQMGVERNQGCNHMVCGRHTTGAATGQGCGHQFCWICLADWNADHYGCRGGVNRPADNGYDRPQPAPNYFRPAPEPAPAPRNNGYFRPAPPGYVRPEPVPNYFRPAPAPRRNRNVRPAPAVNGYYHRPVNQDWWL